MGTKIMYILFQLSVIGTLALVGTKGFPLIPFVCFVVLFARFFSQHKLKPRENPLCFFLTIVFFVVLQLLGATYIYPLLEISEASTSFWLFVFEYNHVEFLVDYMYWGMMWLLFELVYYVVGKNRRDNVLGRNMEL